MSEAAHAVRVGTVVVRRGSINTGELPLAIGEFVQDAIRVGGYMPLELPPKVMQVHLLGYYVGQVNNGGHGQFMHNCGKAFQRIVADVLDGLKEIGAERQHQNLTEFVAWAAEGGEETRELREKRRAGFDRRFHDAENETSIEDLSGRRIAGWRELRIVEDDRYTSAIEETAALNPLRDRRVAWRNVQSIRYQITDPLQIAIAAVCGAVEPTPETKTRVAGGFRLEIEGEQCSAHIVWTDKGKRLCVPDHEGAGLYEYHGRDRLPRRAPDEDIRKYMAHHVGVRLSAVNAATIESFLKAATDTQAPEAIELLLKRAGLNPAAMITAWKVLETEALWIAFTDARLVVARTFPDGAVLRGSDEVQLATITKADIERHAAEIEAVAATMQAPE